MGAAIVVLTHGTSAMPALSSSQRWAGSSACSWRTTEGLASAHRKIGSSSFTSPYPATSVRRDYYKRGGHGRAGRRVRMIWTALDEHSVLSVLVRVPYEHHDSVRDAATPRHRALARVPFAARGLRLRRELCRRRGRLRQSVPPPRRGRALVGRRWRARRRSRRATARSSRLAAARCLCSAGSSARKTRSPAAASRPTPPFQACGTAAENQWRACAPMPRRHGGAPPARGRRPRRDEAR